MSGLIYNTWRGISTVKAFCSPAQPRSARQLIMRAYATKLVRYWQELEAAERASWNDYAVAHPDTDWTGNPKRLSGLNWFVRCNSRLMDMGITPVDTAPSVAAPAAIVSYQALNGVLSSQQIWELGPGTDLMADIWLLGPHSAGIETKINKAKHNSYTAYEVNDLTITGLSVGRYTFWARIVSEVNGLASTWKSDTADITAA